MADNTVSIKITNLREIKAAFKMAPRLMKKELNIAIRKTTLNIQGRSMKNTPVDTGRLRGSTKSLFSDLRGEVGTHTNYDVYVHSGTRFMKARPYLAKAAAEGQSETDAFFTEAVDNVLHKVGKATG